MPAILNVSTYRFVALDGLPALRQRLFDSAQALALKGTVLLAPEGFNGVLAGPETALREWLATLAAADARLAALPVKESWSETVPFQRLKVKVKREIIRMNDDGIAPATGRAPAVDAATLARWLAQGRDDDGRPVVTLDTRNGFEVDAGTFAGAIDWRLRQFSDFPAAFEAHRAELEGKTVVSFCTGGIRCEKAALAMRARGFDRVLQLDGGILKYFEATGGVAPGWRGGCFVFDARSVLAADLAPTSMPMPTPTPTSTSTPTSSPA